MNAELSSITLHPPEDLSSIFSKSCHGGEVLLLSRQSLVFSWDWSWAPILWGPWLQLSSPRGWRLVEHSLVTFARQPSSGRGTVVWPPTRAEELWSSVRGTHLLYAAVEGKTCREIVGMVLWSNLTHRRAHTHTWTHTGASRVLPTPPF